MSEQIKRIKDLTKSLVEDSSKLAKQAEAGFKSQWMGIDDRGEAKWGSTPGIYYSTVGLPALADVAKEGTAPEWARQADEKAGKIRQAVERKMQIEEPKGAAQHFARAAGEMAAQLPVPGAWLNRLRGGEKAVSLARKVATSPIEYLSPIIEVGKAKPTAINYGVGTAFGGTLGTGLEKLSEKKEPTLAELISKYGPGSGTEEHDISKPQKFAKGGVAQKLKEGKSAFFSAVDQAIATLKQEKGTPEQMYSLIEKTPGVKKEELERRGIRKKLEGKKSVTKTELETIAKETPAPAPTVIRKKAELTPKDVNDYFTNTYGISQVQQDNVAINANVEIGADEHGFATWIDRVTGKPIHQDAVQSTVLNRLKTLRDNNSINPKEYQDILADFRELSTGFKLAKDTLGTKYGGPRSSYSGLALPGGRDYQEVLLQVPEEHGGSYRGGHWGSEVPGVVAHYRTQSFVDADGKKVLHVEEVQSDPHQKARDARKQEILKRSENEKAKRYRALLKQYESDPDFLPDTIKFVSSDNDTRLSVVNNKTGEILYSQPVETTLEDAKKKFKQTYPSLLNHELASQVKLSDAELKAIANDVPEDYGYISPEKQAKVTELESRIRKIRNEGLNVDEIQDYYQPGKLVKSWAGTDRVLDFKRGPIKGSPEWDAAYNEALDYYKRDSYYAQYPEEELRYLAENSANGRAADWQVKVVEVDPTTGKEIGSPRWHSTSPSAEVVNEINREISNIGGIVPDMPFKKTYDELALKQIIDDAVNQGYDRVSVSPGLFQVQRYTDSLRAQVNKIEWAQPTSDGERYVTFDTKSGSTPGIVIDKDGIVINGPKDWAGQPLKNVVGDSVATKIMEAPNAGSLEGDNLTIGGKGFTEFYDKRLPNFLKDYLKKEFSASTGRTEFEYGTGRREKSKEQMVNEVAKQYQNDMLSNEDLDRLQELHTNALFDQAKVLADIKGLDFNSDEVQEQIFMGEGIFKDLHDHVMDQALRMLGKEKYEKLPVIKDKANVFAFDITPEMSEKVKTQGQKLFAAAPVVALPMVEEDEKKRQVSPTYTIAPEAKTPALSPEEEKQFQSDVRSTDWFSKFKEKFGEEPNLNDTQYNYRAAWKSGARPQDIEQDDIPHWPSVTSSGESLKARSHPSGWMEDYSQITGRDPSEGGNLTPEQTEAMKNSLMYRYGFAKGGIAKKVSDVLEKMGVDEAKTAAKDLTTLQDFHTSLGDSIRERAAKMQRQMDEMKFKYEPGQRVFTESSAKKNLPPYEIKAKRLYGNQVVREPHPDHPLMGKPVKDPETGKALRTPYEPGYLIRQERGPDDWAEYVIPESAIKGSVEFAKGGIVSKIRELRKQLADQKGEYAAKRLDKAADEIRNLETTYSPEALRSAFMGDNATGLVILNPADFEKYAAKIPEQGYDEAHAGPYYETDDGKILNYKQYVQYLQDVANKQGFRDVPYLEINTSKSAEFPIGISGHEGRHRSRALAGLGDTTSLVRITPRAAIREPLPRRYQDEAIEGLKAVVGKRPVIIEDRMRTYKPGEKLTEEDLKMLPDIFKRGGSV